MALLPFVDERRLRAALADVYPDLTAEEGEQVDLLAGSFQSSQCEPSLLAVLPVPSLLSSSSRLSVRRNSLGSDVLFVGKSHPLSDFLQELYRTETQEVRGPE